MTMLGSGAGVYSVTLGSPSMQWLAMAYPQPCSSCRSLSFEGNARLMSAPWREPYSVDVVGTDLMGELENSGIFF